VAPLNEPESENIVSGLMKWVRAKGGFINSKQEYRREDPDDSSSLFGLFANERIEEGEMLSIIPWDIIMIPPGMNYDTDYIDAMDCRLVRFIVEESRMGNESKYFPYTRYLLSGNKGHIPSVWSEAGINLMGKIIGEKLPPQDITDQYWKESWFEDCKGSDDPLDVKVAMIVESRAEDEKMIPWYDMANHRNGRWLNTQHTTLYFERFEQSASRTIEAGEQIYNSYNMCNECGGRKNVYHTPDILRDYGFVENMPQRWFFGGLGFNLDDEDGTGKLKVSWIQPSTPPSDEIENFHKLLQHLVIVAQEKDQRNGIPDNEWEVIWQYHGALTTAITCAIEDIESYSMEEGEEIE